MRGAAILPVLPVLLGLLSPAGGARAAPVPGCPAPPGAAGASMPLAIDLSGHPGVPSGVSGQVGIAVPMDTEQPPGVAAGCEGLPPLPKDVLAGPPAANILMGPDPGQ